MSYLSDRLQERSTWAGIGTLVGLLPLGVYSTQAHDIAALAGANAPAIVAAAQSQNWVGLVTALCTVVPALLAILWPTSKR